MATLVALLFVSANVVSAQTYSFDPSAVTVTPGESVVGEGKILPNLVISSSAGNDVKYVSTATPYSPLQNAAYGANTGGVMNVHNACLPKEYGIADLGDQSFDPSTKKHDYVFNLVNGASAQSFNIQMVDWGDYLPFGACPSNHCGITAVAYNSNGDVVDSEEKFFTSSGAGHNNRVSVEYGTLGVPGDACTATDGQPGKFWVTLSGTGITQVTFHFNNFASMDPNVAISDINYTADARVPVTPPTQADMCANIDGVQTSVPTDYHLDASGLNCVQFQLGGAPSSSGNDAGGQVLGASTISNSNANSQGQVLGASTMAATGMFLSDLMNFMTLVGSASLISGLKLRSAKK